MIARRPAVFNEIEVRAAAGLTMVVGAVAFAYAYFDKQYVPLQVAASLFFVEFLIRVTAGLRYSPFGLVAGAMTRGRDPDWVSAAPKRFAWSLGLAVALAMTVITNSGIRGYLPRTMCLICLTLMWMESALGLCLGCKIHGFLVRRGWTFTHAHIELCVDCARPRLDHGGARDEISDALATAAGTQDHDEADEVQDREEVHRAQQRTSRDRGRRGLAASP